MVTAKHFARQARKTNLVIAGMATVFDSWYFAAELCKTIDRHGMIRITQSKSDKDFFMPDKKGNPSIRKRAFDFLRWKIRNTKQSPGLPDSHMRHSSGISGHLCICILNCINLSWFRYYWKLNLSTRETVHKSLRLWSQGSSRQLHRRCHLRSGAGTGRNGSKW